jgi:hypothetical protein
VINWLRGLALAAVFALVGAFAASLWLEIRREAPLSLEASSGVWEGRRIRVEILNGAGVDRLAQRATEHLRELGFDVVYYGNAEDFERDSSVAIARLDNVEPARRVADALGLRQVLHQPDRNLYLDVSVVLGRDWADPGELAADEEGDGLSLWLARIKRAARRLWPK